MLYDTLIVSGGAEAAADVDGHHLVPIVKYYRVPKDVMEVSKQKILFE